MAVVYAHYRKTTGEVFNIGIGKTKKRSCSKADRNKYWYNIVNRDGYQVEILCEDITWEQACEAETFLISFYGREDLGLGPLVNLTNGGDGGFGVKRSPEAISKQIANTNYSKIHTKEAHAKRVANTDYKAIVTKKDFSKNHTPEATAKRIANTDWSKVHNSISQEKRNNKIRKPVLQYSKDGKFIKEWKSAKDVFYELGIFNHIIGKCCMNKSRTAGGFIWQYKDGEIKQNIEITLSLTPYSGLMRPVVQLDKAGNDIKEWKSASEAGKSLNINRGHISSCCNKNNYKSVGGFIWKFKNNEINYNI